MLRLPHFMSHYRKLGVDHFLFVDNGSDDGTRDYLAQQSDVSVWTTGHAYRMARFGMDWLGWLQWRYGSGHWCLTVDADELLVYPDWEERDLKALTSWLEQQGKASFGALIIDLYPKGPIGKASDATTGDPTDYLCWFDADNIRHQRHRYYGNLWFQGGVRDRVFFSRDPRRAPTLNKTPLVRWHWRYVYVSSTHQMLPPRLHDVFDPVNATHVTGALLHTKFLPDITTKTREEMTRKQHFANSDLYAAYRKALLEEPDLWFPGSVRYAGAQSLLDHGLMSGGAWSDMREDKKDRRIN